VIFCFVDIGGIVDHQCLDLRFITVYGYIQYYTFPLDTLFVFCHVGGQIFQQTTDIMMSQTNKCYLPIPVFGIYPEVRDFNFLYAIYYMLFSYQTGYIM
jgi:hypothetical protein